MSVLPADSLHPRLAERLFAPLAQLRRRCRLYLLLEGLVRFCLALLAAGLAQASLDRWLRLAVDQRAVLSVVLTLLLLWALHRWLLSPLLRSLSDRSLASAVDRAHPELRDQIATAVQFAAGQVGAPEANSPQLVRAVLADACAAAPDVSFLAVLNHRRARRRCVELAALLLAAVLALLVVPELAGTWLRRNWLLQEVPWPQQTYITPMGFDENGRRRVPLGDELEIAALNRGRVPNSVVLRWWTASGRRDSEPMTLVGVNRWEIALGLLTEEVSFRIVGGDEWTRAYTIEPVDRPRVVRTTVRIAPPEYTALQPAVLEQQTVLELLEGSALRIEAELNKPVVSARFVGGGGGEAAACERFDSDRLRVVWDSPASGSYSFELADRDGWTNRRPVRYTLKVLPDRPPDVQIELPDVGASITPLAQVPIKLIFEDTYGLGGIGLNVQRGDDPPFDVPLEGFEAGRRELAVEMSFAVGTTGVEPGERLRIWAEAHDRDPRGPNVGRSEAVELRVVTSSELLVELASRELELRREFERLLSAQRGLGDAVLRLLPELPEEGPPPPALSQRLAGLARRQESHAGSCLALRRRFAQILGEMRTNQVARTGDERRLGERVIAPLEQLGTETMPAASAAIAELRRAVSRTQVEQLPVRQADILRQMQAILANMLEWEGYREALSLLQEIIAEQSDVRAATLEALERQLEEILELEEPLESAPADEPKP